MISPEGSLIAYFSGKVKKGGGINLAQGRPGFDPPKQLLDILKKNIPDMDLHQYAPGNGDPELLDILKRKHSGTINPDRKNFLIVQGATEGIFLSFLYLTTIVKEKFSALSFDPVYESYPKLPSFLNIPFYYFHTPDDLTENVSVLDQMIREKNVKAIFMASPGNPHGKVWKKEELDVLSEISIKHGVYIIFDAVYSDIYIDEEPFNPMETGNSNILYINSFSKMLSITGWRIGYLFAHKDHMTRIRSIHDYTGLCAPYLLQRSIAEFMGNSGMGHEYISRTRKKCNKNIRYLSGELSEAGFKIPEINGGYFLWAELPEKYKDGFKFAEELYENCKVAVVPGQNFSPEKTNFIRINCAVDENLIKEASGRIKKFIKG